MTSRIRVTDEAFKTKFFIKPENLLKSISDFNKPMYYGTYAYSGEILRDLEEQLSLSGYVSVNNIKQVESDRVWWDFDIKKGSSQTLADTYEDTKTLIRRLNLDEDHCQIFFSGNKGFHVIVKTTQKDLSRRQVAEYCINKAQDLKTFDSSMYDEPQVFRVPFTKHPKTGLFKIPIVLNETTPTEEAIKSILDEAKTNADFDIAHFDEHFEPVDLRLPKVEAKKKDQKEKVLNSTPEIDLAALGKPAIGWKPYKWALANGYFESGERHNALMVIAATCRGLGYDKEQTYYICKSALKKQAEIYGNEEFGKEELWKNIIEDSVFSTNWSGGQYSPQSNEWLRLYCQTHGFKITDEDSDASLSVFDMEKKFDNFAVNFEKNLIKIGIDSLDEKLVLSTSTLVGILGNPGCHAKGTEILMFNGSVKKVEDVEVGDLLMGPDSQPREVLKLCRGVDKMIKVKPSQGKEFTVNQHHIFHLIPSKDEPIEGFENFVNIEGKVLQELKNKKSSVSKCKLKRLAADVNNKPDLALPPSVIEFTIEQLEEGEFFGFTLDKDHLYLDANFIVHHNSGKSSISLGFLQHASVNNNPSIFFSLDMGMPMVYAKLLQRELGKTFVEVTEMFKNRDRRLYPIMEKIKEDYKNVHFCFKSGLNVEGMKTEIERIQDKSGQKIRLTMLDYLECLMGSSADPTVNSGHNALALKDLANETESCVVTLLQTQKHSTPDVSDPILSLKGVKGSSLIEQSCSVITSIWRDGYNPNYVEQDKFMSFAIVKNRFGSLWTGDYRWDGVRGTIREMTEEEALDLHNLRRRKKHDKDAEKNDDW